jgi:hypothetical protein
VVVALFDGTEDACDRAHAPADNRPTNRPQRATSPREPTPGPDRQTGGAGTWLDLVVGGRTDAHGEAGRLPGHISRPAAHLPGPEACRVARVPRPKQPRPAREHEPQARRVRASYHTAQEQPRR